MSGDLAPAGEIGEGASGRMPGAASGSGVDSSLRVAGGTGGVTARYEDMLLAAQKLDVVGEAMTAVRARLFGLMADGSLAASMALSPQSFGVVSGAAAEANFGDHSPARIAAELQIMSLLTRAAVTSYKAKDEMLAAGMAVGGVASVLSSLSPATWALALGSGGVDYAQHPEKGLVNSLTKGLYDDPWVIDGTIDILHFGMVGAGGVVPGLDLFMNHLGLPYPPRNVTEATAILLAAGQGAGLFRTGRGYATEVPMNPDESENVIPPSNVGNLLLGVNSLYESNRDDAKAGQLRIFKVQGDDGLDRWVVEVPGTQVWDPVAKQYVNDLSSDAQLSAGKDSAQSQAIRDAMRQAGIQPGDPVLIAGHSLGGIDAASLASDPSVRAEFNITNVVTAGSPIGEKPIPDDVQVLALEHDHDVVHRLDSTGNPDRPNWTTVHRDPTNVIIDDGADGKVNGVAEAHSGDVYARTGSLFDESSDPSVVASRESLKPFLTSRAADVRTFNMTREID